MNNQSRIKILKMMDVTDLSGEKVMVDFEEGKYFMIKGVGNDIWEMLSDDLAVQSIIDKLLEEYDVSKEVCEREVINFLTKLETLKIIRCD